MLVLRDMIFGDRRHFRELLAGSLEGIASNILADRLKRLVEAELLTQQRPGPGRKAPYSLTEAGIELVPILAEVGAWGVRHRPTTHALAVRAELLAEGGRPMWEAFMDELRQRHLGAPIPDSHGPTVTDQLAHVHTQALAAASRA